MCASGNIRRCLRMRSTHAVVNWICVSRVCECLPVQRHHQHVDRRWPCSSAHSDAVACPNKPSGKVAYRSAFRKSDNVGWLAFNAVIEALAWSCASDGVLDIKSNDINASQCSLPCTALPYDCRGLPERLHRPNMESREPDNMAPNIVEHVTLHNLFTKPEGCY